VLITMITDTVAMSPTRAAASLNVIPPPLVLIAPRKRNTTSITCNYRSLKLSDRRTIAGSDGRWLSGFQHRAFGLDASGRGVAFRYASGDAHQHDNYNADQGHGHNFEVGAAVCAYEGMCHSNPARSNVVLSAHPRESGAGGQLHQKMVRMVLFPPRVVFCFFAEIPGWGGNKRQK
jgi:hypothetical protein